MKKEAFRSGAEDTGKRLDAYLVQVLDKRFSRSQIKRFIGEGKVLVDGSAKKAHYTLSKNQLVEVHIFETSSPKISPEDIQLDVIYEDEDIVVVNKPSGMVVHPASGNLEHTLVNALLFHTKGRLAYSGSSPRPGIVHRLDKAVSGLMVAAKTDNAHQGLVRQFQRRSIRRTYIAFVKGDVLTDKGRIALPIGRSSRDRKKMAVKFLASKDAATRYKVLKRFPGYTKLELSLETGRTHQIRVHMSYMGHPIIGDTKYGGGGFGRIALYAGGLVLNHPKTSEVMAFSIAMPAELAVLERGMAAN